MALQVHTGKIRTTDRSIDQPYYVIDDQHPPVTVAYNDARDAALTQALADFGTAPYDYSLQRLSKNSYEVVAQYRETATQVPTVQEVGGDPRYSFNFQQEAETFKYAKVATTVSPANAPTWGGLIGVSGNVLTHRIEARGITVTPRVTDTVEITLDASLEWTLAYRKRVRGILGKVNSVVFMTEAAGTFRFVACRSTLRSDAALSLQFGFDYRPNVEAFTINGISVPAYLGHQLLWYYEELEIDDPGGREPVLVSQPKYAYIETVHETADLNTLFLAGAIV